MMKLDQHLEQLGFTHNEGLIAQENPMPCFESAEAPQKGCCWAYNHTDAFSFRIMRDREHVLTSQRLYPDGWRIAIDEAGDVLSCALGNSLLQDATPLKSIREMPHESAKMRMETGRLILFEASRAYLQYKLGTSLQHGTAAMDHAWIETTLMRRRLEIRLLMRQVMDYNGYGAAARLYYDAKATELLAHFAEGVFAQRCQRCTAHCRLCVEDQARIRHVAHYLRAHLKDEFDLDTLCHLACMGKTKLKKTFREEYSCSLMQYLQQQRMEKAQRMLCDTEYAVAQVARAVGYRSGGRFASVFRKTTGLLPREYRMLSTAQERGNETLL